MTNIIELKIEQFEALQAAPQDSSNPEAQRKALHALMMQHLQAMGDQIQAMLNPHATNGSSSSSSAPKAVGDANWPDSSGDDSIPPFDPSVPSDAVNPYSSDPGYYDKLMRMVDWLQNHPGSIKGNQIFLQYLMNLSAAGKLDPNSKDPYVQRLLALLDQPSTSTLILNAVTMEGELLWFQDNGNTQKVIDEFINPLLAAIGNPPQNNIMRMLASALQGFKDNLPQFATDHTDAQGNLIWTIFGDTYTWPKDKDMITEIITGQAGQASSQFDLDKFMADSRVGLLEELLKQFKDPMMAILLFILTAFNNQFDTQLGGQAESENDLTKLTNKMGPLINLIQKLGTLSDADAKNLMQKLQDLSVLMNVDPNTAQISGTWNSNVDAAIGSVQVTDPNDKTKTISISDLWKGFKAGTYSNDQLATSLNSLGPNGTTVNPGYTAIIDAGQQGSQLLTGQSKTVESASTAVANTEGSLVKVENFVVDPQGSGPMALMKKLADAQISR